MFAQAIQSTGVTVASSGFHRNNSPNSRGVSTSTSGAPSSSMWKASLAEQLFHIPAAVHHAKNEHVLILILDKVNDDMLTDRKTTQANAKIIVAGTSKVGMATQQEEPLRDGINDLVSDLDASAVIGDVVPDVVEVGRSLRRYLMRH
jgi:hypothetical protein